MRTIGDTVQLTMQGSLLIELIKILGITIFACITATRLVVMLLNFLENWLFERMENRRLPVGPVGDEAI